MRSFKSDYSYGKKSENNIIEKINIYFKDNIKAISKQTEVYDYEGDLNIYELKSRTNTYKAYDTTLLGYNKIIDKDKDQIFLFSFTDGLYYIKYDEELFNTFEKKMFVRNQRSDYNDKLKLYIFIPIDKLIKI
tara:strand:+ start:12787 stop:13185 length:399 start_codon:yes stop_codon:yes gene_type:complete